MRIWDDLLDEVKKNLPDEIECELKLMHSKSALTRFANSQIHQNVDEESAEIYLTIHKDSKTTTISNNLTAIEDVGEFVKKALTFQEIDITARDGDKIKLVALKDTCTIICTGEIL